MIFPGMRPGRVLGVVWPGLLVCLPTLLAAPVAVDDSYELVEDVTFTTLAGPLVETDFDSGMEGAIPFDGEWQYLDRIENSEGAGQDYPVDGQGRAWSSPDFEVASSTVGPWGSTPLPAQGGTVEGFPVDTPDTLQGIGSAPSGLNLVTTYLFRNTFTLTPGQAAETNWTAHLLVDDGCVVYLNGTEVARHNLPPGALSTETFGTTSDETTYLDLSLPVEGLLQAGVNTIAVEVHQASLGSLDVGLDLELRAGTGATGGFVYQDDVFGTSRPAFAEGAREPDAGFSGSGLRVTVGGIDSRIIPNPRSTSGGFTRTITLASPTTVEVSLRYRLVNSSELEAAEFGEAILEIAGTRYGSDTNSALVHIADGGDSGWQSASFTIDLPAGSHPITLGAFNNSTSRTDEIVTAYFDDVLVTRSQGDAPGLLANDTVGANPQAVIETQPAHGSVNLAPDGLFTYTPDADYFGADSFRYTVTDETGTSAPATVTLTITPRNDAPLVTDDAYDATEDTPLLVFPESAGLLANDVDAEGETLSAVVEREPTQGTLTLNVNGTFTYLPDPDSFGVDTFTYRAGDGTDLSDPATVTITVANTPDAPVAGDDQYTAMENQPLIVAGQSDTVVEELIAWGAVWKFDDTGTDLQTAWREPGYDDSQWDSGPAELGYGDNDEATVVSDGGNGNNVQPTTYFRRTIPVGNVDTISACTLWIRRDDGCIVYLNGTQVAIDNLQPGATYATYASNAGDDGNADIEFTVDPALFVEGDNTLAVEIHQGGPTSSDISFDLRLQVTRTVPQSVLANDRDADGDPLTAVLQGGPSHGTVVLNPDGTFTYTPRLNYEGPDSFQYLANDGGLNSPVATVSLEVLPGPNDLPETQPDTYAPAEDAPFFRDAANGVLANDVDPDGDLLTAVRKSLPRHGALVFQADGSFTYTPVPDFFGTDSFTYAAFDGVAESPVQTVTLNVTNVPDAPVARPDVYATNPGEALFVSVADGVLANDSDIDGDNLTAVLVDNVSSGSLTLFGTGSFFYTPGGPAAGVVTFTYRAEDGVLQSAVTTVTIHLDTPPVAQPDSYHGVEDEVLTVGSANGLLANDTDAESDTLTAVLATPASHGSLTIAPDGSFTYQPAADFHGTDSFSYTASDGPRTSAPAVVTITVDPVNDAPETAADSYRALLDQPLIVVGSNGVLANDRDVEGTALTATLSEAPTQGVLVFNPDGSFVYTPPAGFTGDDQFSYQASDGSLLSPPTTVTIAVGGASDSIVINEIMYHPASGSDAHEFIELANVGDGTVNLNGWTFTSGLTFTFPDVSIPAGGFLVVAADPAEFVATYGEVGLLVGGWTGSLSNRGERLKLVDADGMEVDDLEYADQGDWAVRTQVLDAGEPGWVWESLHDGGGSSLELIYPLLTNKSGQNWLPSEGAPTPGAPNSVVRDESEMAPLVLDVAHRPRVPTSTDTVTITVRLRDTEVVGLGATLHYRISAVDAGEFLDVPMADDGLHGDGDPQDGTFGAVLPAMADGTVVEFYVRGSDGLNERTWPAPTTVGQVANALYQVDDELPPPDEGIYRLILSVPENRIFNAIDRDSNAQMNCTLVADDCAGPVVRYLCGMRVRGASSRNDDPPPMRINIPRDDPWEGVTSMNLNSQFTWLQFIGMKLFQASDLAAPDSKRVAVRRNGEDYATGDIEDYGSWVYLQPLDGTLVDEKFPDDPQGNLYKKVRPDVDWAYRDGNFNRYPQDGWGKQTNASENDWLDLDNFLRVMNEADNDPDYLAQVEAVANLDQWMRWFAVEALIANGETNASNGADDDYSMYRGVVDPRFVFLPHDLDTILGQGDASRITDPEFTIFDMIERGDTLGPLVTLFNDPTIRMRYHQALRDLIETSFSKPRFDALITNHLDGWVPPAMIDDVITFMDARRTYISGLVEAELGPAPPRTAATTTATLEAAPSGALHLSEILAANLAAHQNGGGFPDYIELHNAGGVALSLAGFSITDDPAVPRKYVFPAGTSIAAHQHLVLYADSDAGAPGLHLGFALDAGGESVHLFDAAGTPVDSIVFGPQAVDLSIGRTGPGGASWALTQPTPGTANVAQALGDPGTLRLNEWLTKPDLVFTEDFIELYNPDVLPVSLGGLAITDDPLNGPRRSVLPVLSFIAANGFTVLEPVGEDNASPDRASELPFKLSADHSWIAIYGDNGVEIDRVHALCDARDQSQGRLTDGDPTFARFGFPTPGFSNTTDLTAETRLLQSLRITEIMYHPAEGGSDAEFIELRNIGPDPINLLGVSFTRGIDFDFPDLVLAPGEYVVVVANQAVFTALYGVGPLIAGEWSGKLDNDEDRVRLEVDVLNAGILDFTYKDGWFPQTDGGGYTLIILDETAEPRRWDEKEGWTAGGMALGTPGSPDGFFVSAGTDQAVNLPAAATLNGTVVYGPENPAEVSLQWILEDGPAVPEFGSPNNEDTTVRVPVAGRYTFTLIATPLAGPARSAEVTVTFRDTYANWAVAYFGSPVEAAADKLADDDRDGFSNLLEFVLGLDPLHFDAGALAPATLDAGGKLSLTYFRRYVDEGRVTITPEVSSDLITWQSGPGFVTETLLGATVDGEFILVQDLAAPASERARFLRLRVECSE